MMRSTMPVLALAATPIRRANHGPTFSTGGDCHNTSDIQNVFPINERGIRSSSPFQEPNTAIYDTYLSWTYFQPMEVKIDKLPAPEPQYYQRHTKRPWDLSSTELLEIQSRRKYFQMWFYMAAFIYLYFIMPKEKSFSGLHGPDGHYIFLPKNQPQKF